MAGRSRREMHALQAKALSLLAEGATVEEAAAELGVSARTIRRWRQRPAEGGVDSQAAEALAEMLRAESPAVGRVILDLAKGGDVRAAALVVRLLANTLTSTEERDDRESESALHDLECELSSLPPEIASEIVGLLAQAESEAADAGGGGGGPAGGGGGSAVRLPWEEEDRPSDEGDSPV